MRLGVQHRAHDGHADAGVRIARHGGAGQAPNTITVDPSGAFVYVVNQGSNTISAYAIAAGTGTLSQITGSPFATDLSPVSIAVTGVIQ